MILYVCHHCSIVTHQDSGFSHNPIPEGGQRWSKQTSSPRHKHGDSFFLCPHPRCGQVLKIRTPTSFRHLWTREKISAATSSRLPLKQTTPGRPCGLRSGAASSQGRQEVVRHFPESDNPGICRIKLHLNGVYQHLKILSLDGWVEVWILLIDDHPQIFTEIWKEFQMFQQTRTDCSN